MSRSRRLGAATALPAAALAAALVLAPTTAYAAEGDPAAVDAPATGTSSSDVSPTDVSSTGDTTTGAAVTVSGDASPAVVEPAGPDAEADAPATPATGATGASGSSDEATDSAAPEADAPAESSTPTPVVAPTDVVVDAVVDDLGVFIPVNAAHPGQAFPVFAQGFTPGDVVDVTVSGDDVPAEADYVSFDGSSTFDEDGATEFSVELPATFAVGGVVTVTVTDESGLSTSSDVPVTASVPAPELTVPVGATAGIVTVTGEDGIPGGYALVEVYDADELITELPDPSLDADPSSDAEPTGDEITFEIPVDVDPVPYEVSGSASALVPVDADGRFSARFVLPAGDFATDAYTFDADLTTESEFSDAVVFSVAPAVTAPVATTPGTTAPAALPVRPVAAVTPARSSSLAYTGSDPSGALGWAVASVLAGAGALVAGRLRLRRR